jgi:hypothetical protein
MTRRGGPDELAPVEPLGVERKPKAIVPKDLRQMVLVQRSEAEHISRPRNSW